MEARDFIKSRLREYYSRRGIVAPPDIERREFGFGNDKKIDIRHFAFKNEAELKDYFVENVPLYASFSSAHYEFPAARPMAKKNRLGADLIFEFDAECKHNTLTCVQCLDGVRAETQRLMDEFLIPDFGLDRKEIFVTFSGARGYHIHVRDEKVRGISAFGRREIADYLQANDIDFNIVMRSATPASGGWPGRFSRLLTDFIKNADEKNLLERRITKKTRQNILENRDAILRNMQRGNYDAFKGADRVLEKIVSKKIIHLSAAVDQSVTLDISRLIRLPSTIHGGSSLLCTYVHDLDKFNPFRDAVVFYNPPAEIRFLQDVAPFVLRDQEFGPYKKEQEAALPEYAAMFAVCKGVAVPAEKVIKT